MKGQASLEFISVVGIALVISSPFILEAQGAMIDLRLGSETAEFQASLDSFKDTVQSVEALSPPSRRSTYLQVPDDVQQAYMRDEAVVYTRRVRGADTNYSRIFSFPVRNESPLPESQGFHEVRVEATSTGANISFP